MYNQMTISVKKIVLKAATDLHVNSEIFFIKELLHLSCQFANPFIVLLKITIVLYQSKAI